MYGKSYKQWCKEVEYAITKRGFSSEYADAIRHCVSDYYTDRNTYMEPAEAAKIGLYPQPQKVAV